MHAKLYQSKSIIRKAMSEEEEMALKNEIDILSQVDHPNVVKLFEIFENENSINIIMEILTGGEVTI